MNGIRFTLTIATEMKSIRNDRLIGNAYRDTTLSSESFHHSFVVVTERVIILRGNASGI